MEQRDHWPSAVRAAETLLDRSGFHAKTGLVIEDERPDLTSLTKEQLALRAEEVSRRIREAHFAEIQAKTTDSPSADNVH